MLSPKRVLVAFAVLATASVIVAAITTFIKSLIFVRTETGPSPTTSPGPADTTKSGMRMLLPFYVYPSPGLDAPDQPYGQVARALRLGAPTVDLVINPSNGDEATEPPNTDWTRELGKLLEAAAAAATEESQSQGGPEPSPKFLGYLYTSYGSRGPGEIKAVMDGYARHWNAYVDGLFFDEVSSDGLDEAYYRDLRDYATSLGFRADRIVFNPGIPIDASLAALASSVVSFESPANAFDASTADVAARSGSGSPNNPAGGAAALITAAPDLATALDKARIARQAGFGAFFATDRLDYNALPPYFDQLVDQWPA